MGVLSGNFCLPDYGFLLIRSMLQGCHRKNSMHEGWKWKWDLCTLVLYWHDLSRNENNSENEECLFICKRLICLHLCYVEHTGYYSTIFVLCDVRLTKANGHCFLLTLAHTYKQIINQKQSKSNICPTTSKYFVHSSFQLLYSCPIDSQLENDEYHGNEDWLK